MSDFVRKINNADRTAARTARQGDPTVARHVEESANQLRRTLKAACERDLAALKRLNTLHSAHTPTEWDTLLGTAEYDNFKSDFNALRTAVLALSATAAVPAAL
jgi:aminoglycoside phosphotransferase (APT) family kinase protein